MKVSILIPLYNCEKYIKEAIISALNQTWQNKEIIIVDDGSTDNSYNIAKEFESDIVKVYQQDNKGAPIARNFAFEKCTGDYIQYLDADDLLDNDKIEKQMQMAKKFNYNKDILIYCKTFIVNGDDMTNLICPMEDLYVNYNPAFKALIEIWKSSYNSFPYTCFITHKNKIAEIGDWDISLYRSQDSQFFARIISKSNALLFCEGTYCYYRNVPLSLSRKITKEKIYSEFQVTKDITELILKKSQTLETVKVCSQRISEFLYKWYPKNMKYYTEIKSFMKYNNLSLFFPNRGKSFRILNSLFGWKIAKFLISYYVKLKSILR